MNQLVDSYLYQTLANLWLRKRCHMTLLLSSGVIETLQHPEYRMTFHIVLLHNFSDFTERTSHELVVSDSKTP